MNKVINISDFLNDKDIEFYHTKDYKSVTKERVNIVMDNIRNVINDLHNSMEQLNDIIIFDDDLCEHTYNKLNSSLFDFICAWDKGEE